MEFDNLPGSIAFEEDVCFLIVFVGYFAIHQFCFDVQDVAGDGSVQAGTDLDLQVRDLDGLDFVSSGDVGGPVLFVGVESGAAFREPLSGVRGIGGKICGEIVGGVAGVDFLLEITNFYFSGGGGSGLFRG